MVNEIKSMACTFTTEQALYLSYMPFIKGGGLFIRTNNLLPFGEKIKLTIKLLNEPELYVLTGKVIWNTPKGAQNGKPSGIGIQFEGENARALCNKMESCLAGMLKSTQSTDTV